MEQSLYSRLNSRLLSVEEKCVIARNVYFSDIIKGAQKETNLLNWLVKTIIEKYSSRDSEFKDFWKLLSELSEAKNFETYFLQGTQDILWDFLNTVLDNIPDEAQIQDSYVVQFMKKIVDDFKHIRTFIIRKSDELTCLVAKCVRHQSLRESAIKLYDYALQQNNGQIPSNQEYLDVLLLELLKIQDAPKQVVDLVTKSLFSKQTCQHWTIFLKSLAHDQKEDQKPKMNEDIDSLFKMISSMKTANQISAIEVLFKALLQSHHLSDNLKATFYVVCSTILGLDAKSDETFSLSPLAITILPKVGQTDDNNVLNCIHALVQYLVEKRVDLSVNIFKEEQTWMKYLQYQMKRLLTNFPNEKTLACEISMTLGQYCPLVIEPLIGTLSTTVMSIDSKESKSKLMCELISLFQKLRQLPKLIARLLIALSKLDKTISLEWSQDILDCFAEKTVSLPTGQLVEMWKTLEFHIKSNAEILGQTLDVLVPVFLMNACILEQTLPDPTMDKISKLIESTRDAIAMNEKLFPKIREALEEICVTLKHTRGLDLADGQKITQLQKRKLQSLDNGENAKKMKLSWKDIKDNPTTLKVTIDEMADDDLSPVIDEIIENKSTYKIMIQENHHIQDTFIEKIISEVIKTNPKKKWLKHLKTGNFEKITTLFNEVEHGLKIDNTNQILEWLELLPLEHIQGKCESQVTILCIALVKVDVAFTKLLARCLTSTFRSSSILKYLSVSKLLAFLSITAQDSLFYKTILQSLIKLGLTYSSPLNELSENADDFANKLKDLNDDNQVNVSVTLLESLSPVLTDKITVSGEEKRTKYGELFTELSKGLLKGLKSEAKNVDNALVIRALTIVIDVISFGDDSKKLKKWAPFINTYLPMAMTIDDAPDDSEKMCNFKFIKVVLKNYESLKDRIDGDDFLRKFTETKFFNRPLDSNVESDTLVALLETTSKHSSDHFAKLMDILVETTVDQFLHKKSLQILSNWKIVLKAKLEEEEHANKRKSCIEKLLPLMNDENWPLTEENVLAYFLPILNFQAGIFELDKPVLPKETEAFCLSSCLLIKLEKVLEECPGKFGIVWEAVFNVISTAFHKRPSSVITTRIPIALAIVRNLLHGLAKASDQKRQLEPNQLKDLVQYSHNFDRICDHIKKLKDEFARVVPYLIADVMEAFQQVTVYPVVRNNLLFGLYKLLDICDSHSTDFLSGVLPVGRQEMFKHVFANYKQYHKYSGKV